MNWFQVLQLIMYVLKKIKDTDGDGTIDIFDKYPKDQSKKLKKKVGSEWENVNMKQK